MTESRTRTDMEIGLAGVFTALALVSAVAIAGTATIYALESNHTMQLLSGVSLAATLLFGGLAIAALHVFAE